MAIKAPLGFRVAKDYSMILYLSHLFICLSCIEEMLSILPNIQRIIVCALRTCSY